jgi:two-component system phosphate regulon response regulator PhoB
MSASILVVEDEPDISALVAYHLVRETHRVRTVADGLAAIRAVEAETPDLIVLDLMLPGMSGQEVLAELRRPADSNIPVIVLTARREEQDRMEGLRLGADDYVTKPFSPQELVLRVAAVLRRVRQNPPGEAAGKVFRVGPFRIDLGAARAEMDGEELALTPTEFRLLCSLMERRGRVQSRRQLLENVWEVTAQITTRTVDMHVQRLRQKLGPNADWIQTVRGFGYRMMAESTSASPR